MGKGLFCGINLPEDPADLSEMEKKHIPVIEAPDTVKAGEAFQVTIRVGEVPHVMEEGHHIQWIDLYSGGNFLGKVILTPVFTRPQVTLALVKGGPMGRPPSGRWRGATSTASGRGPRRLSSKEVNRIGTDRRENGNELRGGDIRGGPLPGHVQEGRGGRPS
jgi:superoxide reductase